MCFKFYSLEKIKTKISFSLNKVRTSHFSISFKQQRQNKLKQVLVELKQQVTLRFINQSKKTISHCLLNLVLNNTHHYVYNSHMQQFYKKITDQHLNVQSFEVSNTAQGP